MGLRDRIRALFRLFLLFTVLVAVGLVSAITTIRVTIRGREAPVPNLLGMTVDKAQRALENLGLELKIEDKLYSDRYAANQIISQVPASETRMKLGQHVHVLVSLGPRQVAVPNLVGNSARAAEIEAVQRGLTLGEVARTYLPGTNADQDVAQDPPAAGDAVHAPTVDFLVSLGEPTPGFECPRLVGRPFIEVRRELEAAGFKIAQLVSVPTTGAPSGTILSQSPAPGSRIGPDTAFNFQVAP
jgi:serine/threonine-protein kinase